MKDDKNVIIKNFTQGFDIHHDTYDKWEQFVNRELRQDNVFRMNMAITQAVCRKGDVVEKGMEDDRFTFLRGTGIPRAWYNWALNSVFKNVATFIKFRSGDLDMPEQTQTYTTHSALLHFQVRRRLSLPLRILSSS